MKLSKRVLAMKHSPIRKFYVYANKAKAQGKKVYYLNIGQPDIKTPKAFMEAIRNFDADVLAYAPSEGIPELIDNSCIHQAGDYKSLANSIERIILEKDYSLALTKMNLESSKMYKKEVLDKKRSKFWDSFVEDCV